MNSSEGDSVVVSSAADFVVASSEGETAAVVDSFS